MGFARILFVLGIGMPNLLIFVGWGDGACHLQSYADVRVPFYVPPAYMQFNGSSVDGNSAWSGGAVYIGSLDPTFDSFDPDTSSDPGARIQVRAAAAHSVELAAQMSRRRPLYVHPPSLPQPDEWLISCKRHAWRHTLPFRWSWALSAACALRCAARPPQILASNVTANRAYGTDLNSAGGVLASKTDMHCAIEVCARVQRLRSLSLTPRLRKLPYAHPARRKG